MCPVLAGHDAPNVALVHTVFSSQAQKRFLARCVSQPHRNNLALGQLGRWIACALQMTWPTASPFGSHVARIVMLSTQPQVIGIDARGVVASGAIVEHEQSLGNWAMVQYPREAMSLYPTAMLPPDTKLAVPHTGRASRPDPAGWSQTYFRPEPFSSGASRGRVRWHCTLQPCDARPRRGNSHVWAI